MSVRIRPPLGCQKIRPGPGGFLNAEKLQLRAEFAMIAALGFFDSMEIFVEFFLLKKQGVNALELRISFLAFPIGAGNVDKFERLNAFGGRNMRATAEVDEISGGIKRDHRVRRLFPGPVRT